MKRSELRFYLLFNIINCMFHIKLFLEKKDASFPRFKKAHHLPNLREVLFPLMVRSRFMLLPKEQLHILSTTTLVSVGAVLYN